MEILTKKETDKIINTLKNRFENNMSRHPKIKWEDVYKKILSNTNKINTLINMEETGGEPDVVSYDKTTDEYIFYDCSKETPLGRRSLCYDKVALESRKNFKPLNNVIDMAKEIGVEVLNEEEYKFLQSLGEFDLKTSSWLKTDENTRNLGGSIFGDRRYNRVFIYHNGADSYYSGRGFRGVLKI